jgi:aminoglycoside phosphotransferase (APT) family kinase protein
VISLPFVAKYLLDNKVIEPASIIAGMLEVTPLSGRNYNFLVRDRTHGVVLKQGIWLEENRKAFQTEQRFYREVVPRLSPELQAQIPRAILIDDVEATLAIEFVPGAMTASQVLQTRPVQIEAVGRRLGDFLGRFHGASIAFPLQQSEQWLSRDPPWALTLHRPTARNFRLISPGSYQCLKALQSRGELCAAMQQARERWRSDCIIHADIKSDNLLFTLADNGTQAADRMTVVDWELAQLGDPAWDIAGFLHDFFLHWIFSFPIVALPSLEQLSPLADHVLAALRPAVAGLMEAYAAAGGIAPASDLFERAFILSGARLVQFAVEYAQHQVGTPQHCDMALQVAERALCIPGWARRALLEPGAAEVPVRTQ